MYSKMRWHSSRLTWVVPPTPPPRHSRLPNRVTATSRRSARTLGVQPEGLQRCSQALSRPDAGGAPRRPCGIQSCCQRGALGVNVFWPLVLAPVCTSRLGRACHRFSCVFCSCVCVCVFTKQTMLSSSHRFLKPKFW